MVIGSLRFGGGANCFRKKCSYVYIMRDKLMIRKILNSEKPFLHGSIWFVTLYDLFQVP